MKMCKLAKRREDEENYFRGSRLTILSDGGEEGGAPRSQKVVAVCAVWCGWLEGAARGSGNRGCDGGSRYLRFGRD